MSSIIHYRPNIPSRVREDMLDQGPGGFKFGGRFYEVVRERGMLAVVEVDGFDKPAAMSGKKPAAPGQQIGKAVAIAGAAGGTLALIAAGMSYGYAAQNWLLVAGGAYAAAGVSYWLTNKKP